MSSEKTEQPTSHKLRQAREDGQVAKSKDFTQ
ncbi:MAG TPA: EscU/YscU/HrcU family type III secretion system export apparatus switch protein, partial [Burkholderiaceae bacterium]|nr:EscU/YscU/HrcU family type III secretion system export apparatus switch protein [Burkholderiaceae bacterium]